MISQITRDQWNKYILHLYFGELKNTDEALKNCINRAYRDFNRTLHGFGSIKNNQDITNDAKNYLFKEFSNIKTKNIKTQVDFDNWHRNLCLKLKTLYSEKNYSSFYVGQAQKWINMTFKYIFSCGNEYLNGYDEIYEFCHVPIDNILIAKLKELKKSNTPKLKTSWSRINEYNTYLEYQTWFRKSFDNIPLDVEFKLWLDNH